MVRHSVAWCVQAESWIQFNATRFKALRRITKDPIMTDKTAPWPTELRVSADRKTLTVAFDTGERHELAAEYLRACSPPAEVQGHGPSQKRTVPGKSNDGIMKIEPVGNYAVRIHFDDMHHSGIFTWAYLNELAVERSGYWGGYLQELGDKSLSR